MTKAGRKTCMQATLSVTEEAGEGRTREAKVGELGWHGWNVEEWSYLTIRMHTDRVSWV